MNIHLIDENLGKQPGLSPFISPKVNFTKEKKSIDAVVCTDHMCYKSDLSSFSCPKIAWIIEPPIINGENHINMSKPNNYKRFDYVCSHNRWLEDKTPNFKFVPHGGTWLREEDLGLHKKVKLSSMIFSNKNWNVGHKQRKRAFDIIRKTNLDCDFFGSGSSNPIEHKITGLQDYMFSFALENECPPWLFSPKTDYFSEKILDCFLSGTIPIFYGNPSITKYFNKEGIITFSDVDQIPSLLNKITPAYYHSKEKVLAENFEIAEKYMHPENLIADILNDEK